MQAGRLYGASDQTASSPKEKPVHPNDLLAKVHYSLGIDPDMTVLNHLNQPRQLVKGKPVLEFVVCHHFAPPEKRKREVMTRSLTA